MTCEPLTPPQSSGTARPLFGPDAALTTALTATKRRAAPGSSDSRGGGGGAKPRKQRAGSAKSRLRESDVERAITDFLRVALPPDAFAFHVPNEGKRGWREQAKFLKAGGKAGVPDRCVLWRGRAYFLEAKAPDGTLSDAQNKTFPRLRDAGCPVAVVRSAADAERVLRCWGVPLRAAVLGVAR